MNIVRYEPWGVLRKFHDDVNRLFNDDLNGGEVDGSRVATSQWAPAVDIKEEEHRFVLHADVPGVDPKDIDITMDNGILTIKGERTRAEESEQRGFKRVERAYGSFYRRFSLPDSADPEAITASGKDGVLEVVIPKQEKLQPRRIAVN